MKKYIISGIVVVLVGVGAAPFVQRVVSVRELESKVRAITDEKGLTEVPKELQYRVEGTDWYLSGFSCPYGRHKYSLDPYFGFLGEFDLRIDTEQYNALFFNNLNYQTTYVKLNRRDLDFCGSDSSHPSILIID